MTLTDYLSLFPGASREHPRFMALAEAVLRQATDLITLTAETQPGFSFASAEGKQLDDLAAAVGLNRADTAAGPACTDEVFRAYALAKLALWSWDGTNGTVPAVLDVALTGSVQTDNQDGTVTAMPDGVLPAPAKTLFPFPAGVGINEQ